MLKKICKICFVSIITASPLFASAFLEDTNTLLNSAKDIVNDILIPLVFSLALLLFFWGVVKYIWSEGTGKEEGKKIMVWGVIALFVMSCIWGITYFLGAELGVGDVYDMHIPTVGEPE